MYFAGPAADKESIEAIRHDLGLDKPLVTQFFYYLRDLSHGNLGTSIGTGRPVMEELGRRGGIEYFEMKDGRVFYLNSPHGRCLKRESSPLRNTRRGLRVQTNAR